VVSCDGDPSILFLFFKRFEIATSISVMKPPLMDVINHFPSTNGHIHQVVGGFIPNSWLPRIVSSDFNIQFSIWDFTILFYFLAT
jgi:hypothetical protein